MMMTMVLMKTVQVNHTPCAKCETNAGVYWKIQVGFGGAHARKIFSCALIFSVGPRSFSLSCI